MMFSLSLFAKKKKTEIPALPKVITNKSSITLPVIATLELD